MKSSILFLALLVIGFASCTKQYDDDYYNSNTPSYHIDGITDLSLVKGNHSGSGNPFLQLSVVYENSQQERVTLSLENVPAGLYYKINTGAGIPTFNSFINFADSGVAEGNYSIRLVANGELSGRKELVFKMDVTGSPDCSADLIGSGYTTTSFCNGTTFQQSITAFAGKKNRIRINNFNNTGISLYADVSCDFMQLTIPSQTLNGITYSGGGSYSISGSQRFIGFNVQSTTSGGGTTSCSYSLER